MVAKVKPPGKQTSVCVRAEILFIDYRSKGDPSYPVINL